MSSPSPYMDPQWIEISIGVNRALAIFKKMKAQKGYGGKVCFAHPENLARL